jgi:hypothetical protein
MSVFVGYVHISRMGIPWALQMCTHDTPRLMCFRFVSHILLTPTGALYNFVINAPLVSSIVYCQVNMILLLQL